MWAIFTPLDTHARTFNPNFESDAYFSTQPLDILRASNFHFFFFISLSISVYGFLWRDYELKFIIQTFLHRRWKVFSERFFFSICFHLLFVFCCCLHQNIDIFAKGISSFDKVFIFKFWINQFERQANWAKEAKFVPSLVCHAILSCPSVRLSFLFYAYVTENGRIFRHCLPFWLSTVIRVHAFCSIFAKVYMHFHQFSIGWNDGIGKNKFNKMKFVRRNSWQQIAEKNFIVVHSESGSVSCRLHITQTLDISIEIHWKWIIEHCQFDNMEISGGVCDEQSKLVKVIKWQNVR